MDNKLGSLMVIAGVLMLLAVPSAFLADYILDSRTVVANPIISINNEIFSESDLNELVDISESQINEPIVDESESIIVSSSSLRSRSSSSKTFVSSYTPPASTSHAKTRITQSVQDKVEDEGEARVIIILNELEQKNEVLDLLENFEKEVDMTKGFAGYIDENDLEILKNSGLIDSVEEDLPLHTMTYTGFDLIDFEKALVDGRKALDNVGTQTTKFLNGTGQYNLTGMNQTICMIDSGLVLHPEYGSKELGGWDFFYNSSITVDSWNHGSRMGGIIFANGIKVQGLAYKASYVDLRITDDSGGSWTSYLNNALQWCIDNATKFNITTVYIGVGTGLANGTETACTLSSSTGIKINNLTNNNITVLAPSGHNTNHTHIAYPACVANTISVGGVPSGAGFPADTWNLSGGGIQTNRRAGLLDVLAPGGDGITKTTNSDLGYTSGTGIGTSVSTAYVAGASMLLKEFWDARNWNVGFSLVNGNIPNTIEYILKKTGKPIYDLASNYSYPRIDFYKAIMYEENLPVVNLITSNNVVFTNSNVVLEFNVTDQHNTSNCTLYINNTFNQTDTSIINDINQNFTLNFADGSYSWNLSCVDASSNYNVGTSTTRNFIVDTVIPSTVTGLNSPSLSSDWIYWTWTNPSDSDFDKTLVYINGSNVANVTSNYYNATSLNSDESYKITLNTIDTHGLINNTNVSLTNTTIDILPPSSVTSLNAPSKGTSWIYWTWTNPSESDFSQVIIFINGTNVANTSNNYYNATGLNEKASYQIKIHTIDTNNNINNTDVTDIAITLDATAPGTISSLTSPSLGDDWIYWTWTNPSAADFDEAIIYINGTNVANTSNNYYNATGLNPSTTYEINVHTKDTVGNVNTNDRTDTQTTNTLPPSAVSGLSSSLKSFDWIYWTWTNPTESYFDECIIYIDNVNVVNTSNNYFNATGLSPLTNYTIKVHTIGQNGRVNTNDITDMVKTEQTTIDLKINYFGVYSDNPVVDGWTTFAVFVGNIGTGTANNVYWKFESDMNNQNQTSGPFSIAAGKIVKIYPTFKYISSGTYNPIFTIDYQDLVAELNDRK